MDPQSKFEFAEWTDVSGAELKVEVWGKVGPHWHGIEDVGGTVEGGGKGKEKETERLENKSDIPDWRVLEEWNINLSDLVTLPEDVSFDEPMARLILTGLIFIL
jgi:UV radiation resistance-associated gene protein